MITTNGKAPPIFWTCCGQASPAARGPFRPTGSTLHRLRGCARGWPSHWITSLASYWRRWATGQFRAVQGFEEMGRSRTPSGWGFARNGGQALHPVDMDERGCAARASIRSPERIDRSVHDRRQEQLCRVAARSRHGCDPANTHQCYRRGHRDMIEVMPVARADLIAVIDDRRRVTENSSSESPILRRIASAFP